MQQRIDNSNYSRRRSYLRIAVAFLIVTNILTGGYALYLYGHSTPFAIDSQYPLVDPARDLISQEHFLVTLQPLRERLGRLIASEEDFDISVYIEFLNTGGNVNLNGDQRHWGVSLAKLPLSIIAMRMVEEGLWSLDFELTPEDEDRRTTSSRLHTYPEGTRFSIQTLLEELLIRSDNTAYGILLRNLPDSQFNQFTDAVGLQELFDQEGRITAKEYSRVLRALYTASYLNREHSEFILELLNRAEFTGFLRDAVPESVPFPHKFGAYPEARIYNDAGIVYIENRPYLVSVTMNGVSKNTSPQEEMQRAAHIMQAISTMTYEYFKNAQNP